MSITVKQGEGQAVEIEEDHIREWFMRVDVEQARDTLKVCEGIVDTRLTMQPKRKRRSDAGQPRNAEQQAIDLRELGK
jgi:hypothetical protein